MRYLFKTHTGKRRENNEDSVYIPTNGKPVDRLMMVADGIGGHNAGEIASGEAVAGVLDYFATQCTEDKTPLKGLDSAVKNANLRVYFKSRRMKEYEGMGTTITVAMLEDEQFHIAHVGDCRAYHIRGNSIDLVTSDHTLVGELVRYGAITLEEAQKHPQRNVILRALGSSVDVEVDLISAVWEKGEALFLCSDGLTEHVLMTDILQEFKDVKNGEYEKMADNLLKKALEKGGYDNITFAMALND